MGCNNCDVDGVILAGGKSLRMGEPKPFLILDGEYFINRIYNTLSAAFGSVIVIEANATERYSLVAQRVYTDIYKDCGPLAGMHSAFVHSEKELLFFASCDIPLVTVSLINKVMGRYSDCDAVIPRTVDGIHPLCAVYHRSCLSQIEAYLKSGGRSINGLLKQIEVRYIEIEGDDAKGLSNINTPDEYRLLNQKHI